MFFLCNEPAVQHFLSAFPPCPGSLPSGFTRKRTRSRSCDEQRAEQSNFPRTHVTLVQPECHCKDTAWSPAWHQTARPEILDTATDECKYYEGLSPRVNDE